jgi:hypothetical protein
LRISTKMTRNPSQTTLLPSAAHGTKAQKEKAVLLPEEGVVAQDTLAHLILATRLNPATIAPKVEAIPNAHTTKAKAKTPLLPASLAIANPN